MFKPKVTIMIPTYNQEEFISEAIESALMQDYLNLEVVVSDDCSSDRTAEFAQRYSGNQRFRYYKNINNLGRVANYHQTLYHYATGDWVVNLDGDDYYTDKYFISKAIESITLGIRSGENIVAYCAQHTNLKYIKRKGYYNKAINENTLLVNGSLYFKKYGDIGQFAHMACVYSRNSAIHLGFYEKDYLAADFQSFMKLVLNGNIILSSLTPGIWRKHPNNISQNNLENKYNENIVVIKDIAMYSSNFLRATETDEWLKIASRKTRDVYNFDEIFNRRTKAEKLQTLCSRFIWRKPYFRAFISILIR